MRAASGYVNVRARVRVHTAVCARCGITSEKVVVPSSGREKNGVAGGVWSGGGGGGGVRETAAVAG